MPGKTNTTVKRSSGSLSGQYQAEQKNGIGTSAPGVTDDQDRGYGINSLFTDTVGGVAYICLDATRNASVWVAIGSV